MSTVRIAVGEMDPTLLPGTDSWAALIADLDRAKPDIFLLNELPCTPLERIGQAFQRGGDPAFPQLLADYDTFLRWADDPSAVEAVRQDLPNSDYAELMRAADRLSAGLTQFVWRQRDCWHPQFFAGLLF